MNTSPVKIWRNQGSIRSHLGKIGVVKSYTRIQVPPAGFENQAPYPVVLVEFDREKMVGQMVDCDKHHLKIGQRVQAVLRRVKNPDAEGVIPYGVKFKPVQ